MAQDDNQYLAGRLQVMQELYAELFLLLDRSVAEDPLTEQTGGLDQAIAPLMENIDSSMEVFRGEVAAARRNGNVAGELQADLAEFEETLRDGLRIMIDRLGRRAQELGRSRDGLKEKILQLRNKKQGAQAYRGFKSSKLIDSQI